MFYNSPIVIKIRVKINMKKFYLSLLGLGFGVGILTNSLPNLFVNQVSSTIVQAQENNNLDHYTGYWQIKKIRHGDNGEQPSQEDVYFAKIGDNLVGILDETTLLQLNLNEQNEWNGQMISFNFHNNQPMPININVTSPDPHTLILEVKLTEVNLEDLELTEGELNDLKNLFSFDLELTLDHMNPEKIAEFEARSSVGQLARGEQVYYAQMNEFTDNLEQFAAGFKTETEFYQFKIKLINPEILQILAIPKIEGLNSYLGGVFAVPTAGFKSKYIICETENSQLDSSVIPTLNNDELSCPDGFNVVDY